MSGAELYMALQRGTVDGAIGAIAQLVERKLYEVSPYLIRLPVMYTVAVICMNIDFFSKLPKELQQVVLDVSKEVEKKSPQPAMEADIRNINILKEKGLPLPYTPTQAEMALWEKAKHLRESSIGDEAKELLKRLILF